MYRMIIGNADPLRVSNKDDVIATLLLELSEWSESRVNGRQSGRLHRA